MSYRAKLTKLCRTRTIFFPSKTWSYSRAGDSLWNLGLYCPEYAWAKRSSFKVYSIISVHAQPVTRYDFGCLFVTAVTLFCCYFFSISAPYFCPVQCCFISFSRVSASHLCQVVVVVVVVVVVLPHPVLRIFK